MDHRVASFSDIAHIHANGHQNLREHLRRTVARTIMGIGIPVGAVELAALAHWIRKGDRKPFLGVELLVLPLALALVRFYRERVAFLCPHCHHVLQPEARKWFLAMHIPPPARSPARTAWIPAGARKWPPPI